MVYKVDFFILAVDKLSFLDYIIDIRKQLNWGVKLITDKCINCKIDISEQIVDAIADSRQENWDGYYDNDSDSQYVYVNCKCGCLNEIEHQDGMVITITRGIEK